MKYFFIGLISAVLIVILTLYSAYSWGYVAVIFYNWFITPYFPGLPVFTWMQFAGFMLMVNCFVHAPKTHIKKEYTDEENWWVSFLLTPWLTLIVGLIFHLFTK